MLLPGTRLLRILEKLNMALIEFFRVLQSHVHSALFNVCFISDITDVNHYCISLRNAFNLQSSGPKFVFERGWSAIQSQMCSYLVVPTGFLYTCYRATTGRTNTSVGTILRTWKWKKESRRDLFSTVNELAFRFLASPSWKEVRYDAHEALTIYQVMF